EPAEKTDRGTTVEIKLKEDAKEFADAWRIRDIILKHSDFVSFPIYVGDDHHGPRSEAQAGGPGSEAKQEAEPVNRRTALWRQPASDVADQAANDFYKQLTLDFDPPLARAHLNTDAPVQI